ncbi:Hypothetical Protein FCC1311_025892 [Hondaea fermentalgiana]|uniref:Uncharacterized protein n=1 Tax=Hondaea fermentalgiana TaxID=2315210 RepID=A0A2R5G9A9_9STRA|nr:Hypothetical Protein FCC1311_025892 [Hondaea fermentalgiana]|eukprot:GBG26368.1 Hypothetical Protein FCC1311_025892 [Hondaea fermentalgiana]
MPVTVARLVREVHFVALAWFLAGLSRGVSFVGVSADAREWAEDYDDTVSVRVSFSEAVNDEWILVTAIKNFICTGLMVCEGVCILRYCKIFSDENETPSPRRLIVVLASSLCLIGIGLASIPLGCVAVGVAVEASKTLYLMTGVDVVQVDPVGSSKPKASNDDETETWEQHLSFSIETTKQFDQLMDQGFCLTQVALPKESDPNEAVVTPTAHLLIDVATYRWDAPSSRADLENVTSGLSLAVDAPEKSGLPLSFTQAILGLPVDTQATVVTAQAGQCTSGASRPGAVKRKAPETTGRHAVSAHDVDWIIYIVHLRDLVV